MSVKLTKLDILSEREIKRILDQILASSTSLKTVRDLKQTLSKHYQAKDEELKRKSISDKIKLKT